MTSQPVSYEAPGRFRIISHNSSPALYPKEVHDEVQVCIPFPRALYCVRRLSGLGRSLIHELGPRDILAIPSGQPHELTWRRRAHIVSLMFTNDFIAEVAAAPTLRLRDTFTVRDPFISAAAVELRDALAADRPPVAMVEAMATAIAYRIAGHSKRVKGLDERGSATPFSARQFKLLDDYVEAHLDQQVTLRELAQLVDLSQWHFLSRFRASYGMSPQAFIGERRFERARRLLEGSNLTIMQIALEIGLSHSHFSRSFLERFGSSPSEYRKRVHS